MATSTDVEIRAPRSADSVEVTQLAALLTTLGYPTTVEQLASRLRAIEPSVRREDVTVLVAARGAEVMGLATVHLYSVIHVDDRRAQLTALVVGDAFRRHGIGRSLVMAAAEWARAGGSANLTLTTALHRAEAHAFYERLGFAFTGRRYVLTFPARPARE